MDPKIRTYYWFHVPTGTKGVETLSWRFYSNEEFQSILDHWNEVSRGNWIYSDLRLDKLIVQRMKQK